jgi:hypothetical protein
MGRKKATESEENTKKKEGGKTKAANKAKEQELAKDKAEEDQGWAEDSKLNKNKQKRAAEKDDKKNSEFEKKAEMKQALAADEEELLAGKKNIPKPVPMTQWQSKQVAKKKLDEAIKRKLEEDAAKNVPSDGSDDIGPNWNHIWRDQQAEMLEKYGDGNIIQSSGIDGVFSQIQEEKKGVDMHPEKRAKAAWMSFMEVRTPEIKDECPGLKRSQRMQMISKEWRKHPENPMNMDI